ncbi:hypothetical protein BGX26_003808 [Mortierella sp. AD094]|nr:hypothetical protein BGX26_003808 [Mortierella sp. AD094]
MTSTLGKVGIVLLAPHGDSFLGLDRRPLRTEVHQCKLVDKGSMDYLVERKKAASGSDFFILFTSKELNVQLPSNSGVVDRTNWDSYFGPFAGRAHIYASTDALDINYATRTDLMRMEGVCEKTADAIISERSMRIFDSREDAKQRLKCVGEPVLMRFKFLRSV